MWSRSTTRSVTWRSFLPHTLAEKIVLSHCDADEVAPGDVVMVRCDVVMANDVSGPVAFRQLAKMGVERVFDSSKVVMVADHFMPAKDARSAELQRRLKEWSDTQGVTFYGQGRGGIEHTLLCEEGWVVPGSVIAGGDSHTCTYGALGAFGSGLGSTDIAACLALGEFWQTVPATIQIEFTGEKRQFVTGKDLILAVLAEIGVGGGANAVLEFVGDAAEKLSVDERLAVSNMAVEAGAETGVFPADDTTAEYLAGRIESLWQRERSDPDAEFARRLRIDLADVPPLIALPHLPGNVVPVDEVAGTRVDQVYIGNCANGTMTDLRQAAEILGGRRVHPDCRAIVVPATQRIYREALREGLLDLFVEADVIVSTPTCGACFGGHMGVVGPGERAVATTNRNFKGRMGSTEAEVYLANAYVAAAAAVAGEIVTPTEVAA
jgi:3-isopropylmalate/(R)-2-methylmalate dehydratase large subunit